MRTTDFHFHLPESLIASEPCSPRDRCRLLVLHENGSIEHRRFNHLREYLLPGDLLIMNNTKVFPARIIGKKRTGGKIEFLVVKDRGSGEWEVLCREKYSGILYVSEELTAEMREGKTVTFSRPDAMETLWNVGLMPIPPYITRKPDERDKDWYQTVYADRVGSIAAPTAGLHFTRELLKNIEKDGVIIRFLTLHVGTGTFRPVRAENVEDHTMNWEFFEIDRDLIRAIERAKGSGGKVVSVGTTTTRAIEGFYSGRWKEAGNAPGCNGSIKGYTDLFIYPGYAFKAVDSLLTNFHLPGSTPLMLTSSLCGLRNLMDAYRAAISMEYRFFSYGDAMLIL